ncbi:MAG: hypothetical protein KDA93_10875 [Planctomycetaceae bacterium]|nr:hypothetical protein [Planctomycetaceae bacterium]
MTATSLTSRVSTRLPFQTLSPSVPDVEPDVVEQAQVESTISIDSPVVSHSSPSRWLNSTTLLLIAEHAVRVLQPLAIGLAINDLLARSYQGVIFLVGQHLTHLFLNRLRQMSITRQINRMIEQNVDDLASNDRAIDASAETQRLHEQVELKGHTLPQTVHVASTHMGALILVAWFEWTLVPLCLLLLAPVILLNTAFGRKSQLLGRELVQNEERETQILATGDAKAIRQHFDHQNQTRLQLVNVQTSSFFLMQLFVLGLLATALIHSCLNTSAQPGHIVAVLLAVLWYTSALNDIPVLARNVARLSRNI